MPPPLPEIPLYNDQYKLAGPDSTDLAPGGDFSPAPPPPARSAPEWLLLVVWRQKWLVLTVLALGVVGAGVYMKWATPLYASTARLLVQPAGPILGQNQPGLMQQGGGANYLHTQKELLSSEPVLAIALGKLRQLEQDGKITAAPKTETALKDVVATDLDRNNDFISVTAYSPRSQDAEVIANSMVDAYMAYQTKPKASNTNDTLELLEEKKKDVEAKLLAATQSLQELEAQYGPLNQKDDRTNVVVESLRQNTTSLVQAQRETVRAKSDYEQTLLGLGVKENDPLQAAPHEADGEMMLALASDLPTLSNQRLQLQTLLLQFQQNYLPNHPNIIELKRRLTNVNRQYLAAVRHQYVTAMRQEADIQKRVEEEKTRFAALNAHAAQYVRLQDDVDRMKKDRDDYTNSLRNIRLAQEAGGLTIDIVERAQAKPKPSVPNPTRVLPIGLAVGLLCGLFLACVREWVDDRLHSAGDVKSSLGMPVLAVIPQSPTKRTPSVSGQRILLDPASDTAEAYRALRTAVQFAAPEGQLKTLLVTSPAGGDGRTTLVSNLAIALAQAGKKVCLVDCDLRKPMQHEIFGVKNNTGLSMLLGGRCSLETATQRGGVTGLEVLPCGPTPANPSEILNSREFGDVLEQLADKYDYVVIDSPPVESVNDSRIVAALCDATLVVLKAQSSHRRQAERARNSLLGVGARIIGVVVNDLPRRAQASYSHAAASRRLVPGLTSQEYDILQTRTK